MGLILKLLTGLVSRGGSLLPETRSQIGTKNGEGGHVFLGDDLPQVVWTTLYVSQAYGWPVFFC